MRKILFILILVFASTFLFAQSIVPRANNTITVQDGRVFPKYNQFLPQYQDTTAANTQKGIDSCGAVIYVRETNSIWYRQCSPKKWIELGDVNGITDFNIINDSTLIVCYSNGSCDTLSISLDISITNIYNNSITNITLINGDSCVVIQRGNGNNVDTFCVDFVICSYGFLNDSTLEVCTCADTLNTTPTCDTINIGQQNLYIFQNWTRQPAVGITEFGSNSPSTSPGLMLSHNTYTNTGYYKMDWAGYSVYDAPHNFSQQQSFQNGTPIVSFLSPGDKIQHSANVVKLYFNRTDSMYLNSPSNIEGYFGTASGYSIGNNWVGHGSYGLYLDNQNSKTTGIFFHDLDSSNTDGVTIYAAPDLAGTPPVFNGALKNYKTAAFNTDGSIKFNRYTTGNFEGGSSDDSVLVITAAGNILKRNASSFGGSGSTNSNIGSGYRWAVPNTNNIKTFFGGYGTLVDSTTNANALTLKVDTTLIQNKIKYGADFTTNVDSLFLKGAWVNVKDFGATGNGTTDDKAAFVAAVATGKNVFVPAGTFKISAVFTLQDDQTLFGLGNNSILKTTANDRIVQIGDRGIITGLKFIGSGKGAGLTFQTGILLFQAVGWSISNCYFTDFSGTAQQNGGGAIYGSAMAAANSDGGRISNCYFYNNNGGLVLSQRAEFVTITGCLFGSNTVGVGLGSGNITLNSSTIQGNTTGVYVYNGTNDAHSEINGCLVDHNTYPFNINDVDYGSGLTINNCMIYYGALKFQNSGNIKFTTCHFDQLDSVHIDNSVGIQRENSWWGKTQAGNVIPINLFNGGQNFAVIGDLRYDASTANYWIKQQTADTVLLAGQVYLTGIPSGGTAADSVLVSTSTGQTKKRDGSGLGVNIYNSDGTLMGNREMTMGTDYLRFTSSNVSGTTTSSALQLAANSLTSGTGFYAASSTLSSGSLVNLDVNSTAATSSTQAGLNILTRGTNSTAAQITYGIYSSNTHDGTTSKNYAVYGTSSGGASQNYGVVGVSTGTGSYGVVGSGTDRGVYGTGSYGVWGTGSSVGTYGESNFTGVYGTTTNSGGAGTGVIGATNGIAGQVGVYGLANLGGLPLQGEARFAATNTVIPVLNLNRRTSTGAVTPTNGIGGSLQFYVDESDAGTPTLSLSNELNSVWTDVTHASRTSTLTITSVTDADTHNNLVLGGAQSTLLSRDAGTNQTSERYSVVGTYKTLTESSATAFVRVNVPTGTVTGGEIIITVEANDAAEFQSRTLRFIWSAVNKGGTITANVATPEESVAVSSGTLTVTIDTNDAGSGNLDFRANAVSSLGQSVLRCTYQVIKNLGTGAITPQ